jgi:hypothetical protein
MTKDFLTVENKIGGQRFPGCRPEQVIPDGADQHNFCGQNG